MLALLSMTLPSTADGLPRNARWPTRTTLDWPASLRIAADRPLGPGDRASWLRAQGFRLDPPHPSAHGPPYSPCPPGPKRGLPAGRRAQPVHHQRRSHPSAWYGGGDPRALQQKRGNAGLLIPLPTPSIGPGLLYQEACQESLERFDLLVASVFPRPESHRRWH